MQQYNRSAFTLVELSIVIVIIGLLVGTVLGGQAMLNAQRLRKVAEQAGNYMTAINQFKQAYQYLPGDFPTATSVWGRADGGSPVTSNCASDTASTGSTTCNGNGDGTIMPYLDPSGALPIYFNENTRAWQHMKAAGLLVLAKAPGNSSSLSCNGSLSCVYTARPDTNVPAGPVTNSMFVILAAAPSYTYAYGFGTGYNNAIAMYAPTSSNSGQYDDKTGVLTGADAYSIDSKMDDAMPGTGNVRTVTMNGNANCSDGNGTSATPTRYIRSANAATCPIIFMNSYGVAKNLAQ